MSHLTVVSTVVVLFVLAQIFLSWKITRKRNSYLSGIKSLWNRKVTVGSQVDIRWFDLFDSSIRNSSLLLHARASALQHAEEQVYSFREYAILQRLGVAAPLLGVILTAIGFLTIEDVLSNLSSFAPPLASGVLAGASLSILNQALLVKADIELQVCMERSRGLVDHFWQQQASRLVDSNAQLLKVAASFDKTVNRLGALIDEFPSDVSVLTTKFTNIATIATSTYASINKLVPTLDNAVSAWDRATNTFQQSVEAKFVEAIRSLCACAQTLPTFVRTLEAVTTDMRNVTRQFEESSDAQAKLTSANTAWARDMLESHTVELNRSVSELSVPLGKAGEALQSLAPAMAKSTTALDAVVQVSQSYSALVANELSPAKKMLSELAASATGLVEIVDSLRKTVSQLEISTTQNKDIHESLEFALRARAIPTVEVLQRATGTFEDAAHRLAECAEGLGVTIQDILQRSSELHIRSESIAGEPEPNMAAREVNPNAPF